MCRVCQSMPAWCLIIALHSGVLCAAPPEVGPYASFHAFEHLNNYAKQAEAAAASGATVIYATGLGVDGYNGLPSQQAWQEHQQDSRQYVQHAKSLGIEVVMGYLCATSIVGLEEFDAHWPEALRETLSTKPEEWLQRDKAGETLLSWYGGEYRPACMNHPDWRTYQKFMVRAQLETGHDGIFFDNPTVHPQGCYCNHCMAAFSNFMAREGVMIENNSTEGMRKYAELYPDAFRRFRCTTARDFFAEMRAYARTINPDALITANNSLNHRDVLFSQCHDYAYNIFEMSKTQDYVVIEDMSAQPRLLPDGSVLECAPTYAQLHALIHGKPLVAVTIAENDYHTPPNLVGLAMFEAAAHRTGYMLWSCWPDEQRSRMTSAVRPYADWLKRNAKLFNNSLARRDVVLFLPFRQWVASRKCAATATARELTAANIAYEVVSEERFKDKLASARVVLLESSRVCTPAEQILLSTFTKDGGAIVYTDTDHWMEQLQQAIPQPSVRIEGPKTIRAVVRDTANSTLVFVYNLNIERISSFEDKIAPADRVAVDVRTRFPAAKSVTLTSPETPDSLTVLPFTQTKTDSGIRVRCVVPKVNVGALLLIEPGV